MARRRRANKNNQRNRRVYLPPNSYNPRSVLRHDQSITNVVPGNLLVRREGAIWVNSDHPSYDVDKFVLHDLEDDTNLRDWDGCRLFKVKKVKLSFYPENNQFRSYYKWTGAQWDALPNVETQLSTSAPASAATVRKACVDGYYSGFFFFE